MAEFEELRLTVTLVDNASSGLQRLRVELGQLVTHTDAMTLSINGGVAALNSFNAQVEQVTPGVRSLNQHMATAQQSAHRLTSSMMELGASTQGLSALPALANSVRGAAMGIYGLSTALAGVGAVASSVVVTGLATVALAVVTVGAAVVAYGVSVFKFAKEMEGLGKTARMMGMSFAELKYAQDQAKRYGQSAENVVRSYQGIQAAQLDLYKNNSQLRQKLLAEGVDSGWIAQLQQLDPNQTHNAILRYGKALEAQALASGAIPGVAARIKNDWGKQFGLNAEAMAGQELPPISPKKREELDKIETQSRQITGVWREIVFQWSKFSKNVLAAGLPHLLKAMQLLKGQLPKILPELKIWIQAAVRDLPKIVGQIPAMVRRIGIELKGVIGFFQGTVDVLNLLSFWAGKKHREKAGEVIKNWWETPGWGFQSREQREKSGKYHFFEKEAWGFGTPGDQYWINRGLDPKLNPDGTRSFLGQGPSGPRVTPPATSVPSFAPKQMNYRGASNDNNPLLVRASFAQRELRDSTIDSTSEIVKLTIHFERLNEFLERIEMGGGAGGGGFRNASFGGSAGAAAGGGYGGGQGGGGRYGGASGNYGAGGPAGLSDMDGKGIDPETMKQVEVLGRAGDTAGLEKLFAAKGYKMSGPACGIVASKYVMSAGFKPPPGGAVASNWLDWGQKMSPAEINAPDRPFGSMVGTYNVRRYGGGLGSPLGKGQTGGHVMTVVPGTYDAKTNKATFVDQYGVTRREAVSSLNLRYASDETVAEVRAKRSGDSARVDGVSPEAAGSGSAYLAAKRAGFKNELQNNPETRKLLGAILSAENPGAGPAVVESLMNRTELVNESRAERGLPPLSLRDMIVGKDGKSFYGPIRSGAINQHLAKMNNPAYAAQMNRQIDAALGGSNTIASHTDQGSKGDPNYEAGGIGVNINGERFNDWGYAGSRAWRERRQREIVAANAAAAKTKAANANIPELKKDNVVPIRPGPTLERAALERDALSKDKSKVETDGKLKVEVKKDDDVKDRVKVTGEGSGVFKKTETESDGGMSKETAKKLLATN